jgi:mannitol/fructose-specific phosphotransferase system IIA component (Ntr-type)
VSTLAQYTSPTLLIPQLRQQDATGVVGELCSLLHREGCVETLLPFYNAVITHEAVSSTATAPGWAMPHARLHGLPRLCFAVGRSAAPFPWFGQAEEPVQLVFLSAVPENEGAAYLALISGLARLSQNPVRLRNLLEAADSQAMFEVLAQIPVRQPVFT